MKKLLIVTSLKQCNSQINTGLYKSSTQNYSDSEWVVSNKTMHSVFARGWTSVDITTGIAATVMQYVTKTSCLNKTIRGFKIRRERNQQVVLWLVDFSHKNVCFSFNVLVYCLLFCVVSCSYFVDFVLLFGFYLLPHYNDQTCSLCFFCLFIFNLLNLLIY